MTFDQIAQQFQSTPHWQEKYRLLIQLSRTLDEPSATELASWTEIEGCESRLWVSMQEGKLRAYSNARLMQGILVVAMAFFEQPQTSGHLLRQLDALGITASLTSTRLNGLKQLQHYYQQEISACS